MFTNLDALPVIGFDVPLGPDVGVGSGVSAGCPPEKEHLPKIPPVAECTYQDEGGTEKYGDGLVPPIATDESGAQEENPESGQKFAGGVNRGAKAAAAVPDRAADLWPFGIPRHRQPYEGEQDTRDDGKVFNAQLGAPGQWASWRYR